MKSVMVNMPTNFCLLLSHSGAALTPVNLIIYKHSLACNEVN